MAGVVEVEGDTEGEGGRMKWNDLTELQRQRIYVLLTHQSTLCRSKMKEAPAYPGFDEYYEDLIEEWVKFDQALCSAIDALGRAAGEEE